MHSSKVKLFPAPVGADTRDAKTSLPKKISFHFVSSSDISNARTNNPSKHLLSLSQSTTCLNVKCRISTTSHVSLRLIPCD